ncbi:MAG: hypothetical protein KAX49_14995 [Halanaerobiales bacterium]|nr:hypothetical protein [Halanaerobiales bacterium]
MRKNLVFVCLIVLIGVLVAGCSLNGIIAQTDVELIRELANSFLDDATDILESESGDEFNDVETLSVILANENYAYKAKFTRKKMEKIINNIEVDEELGIGTAEIAVTIPGQVELFDENSESQGFKDATLSGISIFEFEKSNDRWRITKRTMDLSTQDTNLEIEDPILKPQPVAPGGDLTISVNITGEDPQNIRALVRNRVGTNRKRLYPTSEGDFTTIMPLAINSNAEIGTHIGIIKAVVWGSVRDLTTDEDGNFTVSVQMSIRNFFVEVGNEE